MKKLIFAFFLSGISLACKPSEPKILYIAETKRIYRVPEKVDIQYKQFIEHLGLLESSNRYGVINSIGCMGRYQIAPATLKDLGYNINPDQFRVNPAVFPPQMQDQVLNELIKHNEKALEKYMDYVGKTIRGVLITKAGLLGACHLGGIGGVKKFLTSNSNPTDMNGTTIQKYLKEFQVFTI